MGIPFFAKSITRKYPGIIVPKLPSAAGCARLYLDLNCAIHQCAAKLLPSFRSKSDYEAGVVRGTIDYIHKIVSFVPPAELLFIAIDGIPPRAKMVQQRSRRFVSAWRKDVLKARAGVVTPWDNSSITPGTPFMQAVCEGLKAQFVGQKERYPFDIVLSDSNSPGEGEAKIMAHIRANGSDPVGTNGNGGTNEGAGVDVVYGLDADLIMLSLAARDREIFLLREPAQYDVRNTNAAFLFFDIGCLYRSIEKEYGASRVRDYVVLCFILGNDFLPPLGYLKIRCQGIDIVMKAYAAAVGDSKEFLVTDAGINYGVLLKVLEHLKDAEDMQMQYAEKDYYDFQARIRAPSQAARVEAELDNYPSMHKAPSLKPEKSGWRLTYYHDLFKTSDLADVNDICANYLEAIEWTYQYYFEACVSQDWHYKYDYSPTVLDLHNYLMTLVTEHDNVGSLLRNQARSRFPPVTYDTDLQLLMVLPPASQDLVKPELRKIMTDVGLGCTHMYPSAFKIGTYLKTYLWECHPKLPPVEAEKLRALVDVHRL
jgi:5'-3' exoribonuclease 1